MEPTEEKGEEKRALQCKGIKRDGTQCRNPPMAGEHYCQFHISQKDQPVIAAPSESPGIPGAEAAQSWVPYGLSILLVIEILLAFWLFVTDNTDKLGAAILLIILTMPVAFWSKAQDSILERIKRPSWVIGACILVLTILLYFAGVFVAVVKVILEIILLVDVLVLLWSIFGKSEQFKEMGGKGAWIVGSLIVMYVSFAGIQSLEQTGPRETASQNTTEEQTCTSGDVMLDLGLGKKRECPTETTYKEQIGGSSDRSGFWGSRESVRKTINWAISTGNSWRDAPLLDGTPRLIIEVGNRKEVGIDLIGPPEDIYGVDFSFLYGNSTEDGVNLLSDAADNLGYFLGAFFPKDVALRILEFVSNSLFHQGKKVISIGSVEITVISTRLEGTRDSLFHTVVEFRD